VTAAFLIVRIALAALFLVAALSKLAARQRTWARVRVFGVPERLARPVAVLLPLGELAIALLLVPASAARIGGILAGAALLMFSAAVARLIARGEAPECNCFGLLHSSSVGPGMLARNLCLAGIALGVAIVGAGTSPGISGQAWTFVVGLITLLVVGMHTWAGPHRRRTGAALLQTIRKKPTGVDPGSDEPWRSQ
jgi:uncharacterized membrane protein YphA (DoxX/SURF4 family)